MKKKKKSFPILFSYSSMIYHKSISIGSDKSYRFDTFLIKTFFMPLHETNFCSLSTCFTLCSFSCFMFLKVFEKRVNVNKSHKIQNRNGSIVGMNENLFVN